VCLLFAMTIAFAAMSKAENSVIRPGEPWLDDRGKEIQAHGGGIIKLKSTYYWFGEDRSKGNDPAKRYVACYSSKDLIHWKFLNQVLAMSDPENLGTGWILERPKVFHNTRTGKFVMYAHIDGPDYKFARVAVAVSDKIDGTYRYVKSFRPLDKESRDIGGFIDDDGSAYVIFESRPTKGFYIAKLSSDYMNVEKEIAFIEVPLEGGAIVHYQGMYYVVGSHLTGWEPNPNVVATASRLSGPWSQTEDIAPPGKNTYNSQSSMLIKVVGRRNTVVIFAGDRWNPKDLEDSRYVWMPVRINKGNLSLPPPQPWTIDVQRGVTALLP